MDLLLLILFSCIIHYTTGSEMGTGLGGKNDGMASMDDKPIPAISASAQEFLEKLKAGGTLGAWQIFNGGDEGLKMECANSLTSLTDPELEKLAEHDIFVPILVFSVALAFASGIFVDRLFARLKLQDDYLAGHPCSAELASNTVRFISVLKRIASEKARAKAVESGVRQLIEKNRSEHLVPLAIALEAETSFDPKLRDVALNAAFERASRRNHVQCIWIMRLYHNLAITPETYSDALAWAYYKSYLDEDIFALLLRNADRQDLEKIQREEDFGTKSTRFQETFNNALATFDPTKPSRSALREKIIADTKAAISGLLGSIFPTALHPTIIGYIHEWELPY